MSGNVYLVGFSGTGKSSVGVALARRLGWAHVDTDDELVRRFGKPIAAVFAEDGEEEFRAAERAVVAWTSAESRLVVSLGGGAFVDPDSRRLAKQHDVVRLTASAEEILRRLAADVAEVRPLLDAPDALARVRELLAARDAVYSAADMTVDTEGHSPEEVAERIAEWLGALGETDASHPSGAGAGAGEGQMIERARIGGQSEILIAPGALTEGLAGELDAVGLRGRVFVFADERVFPLHGEALLASLRASGLEADACVLPAGEPTKSLGAAFRAYDWLAEQRCERGDAILALGGGVVGDLAGFVAATYLRGLPLVQAPTTLLAQVDSSIGGKVAVNHPRGKNLVGAFYPARLIVVDTRALLTLPRRDLASGWAEVIKTAMILDAEMLEMILAQSRALLEPALGPTTELVRRSIKHKVDVVAEDPTERGRRVILNYGHTIAHALESATGYGQILHGEAVALGMRGEAEISRRLGLLSSDDVERQNAVLDAFELPKRARDLGVNPPQAVAVLDAMLLDKKVREKTIRWVLLEGIGRPTVRSDVPTELVREVVEELL